MTGEPLQPRDASVTFVSANRGVTRRAQLSGWERDLLLAVANGPEGGRGIEGAGLIITIEKLAAAGLVTLRRTEDRIYAEATEEGRTVAARGWYQT